MSVSPEGTLDKKASASTALLPAGRSGILPLYLNTTPDTSTWSCRFSPTPGRFSTTSIPRPRSAFASPTPESIRSLGLLMVPAASITSLSAAISFTAPSVISLTPKQRVPLKFSFTTLVLSSRVRFGRPRQRRAQEGANGAHASPIRGDVHIDVAGAGAHRSVHVIQNGHV